MTTRKLKIEGMTCNGCANRVAKALKEVPGVADVRVLLAAGIAEVDLTTAIDPALLTEAVVKKGYGASVAS